jgi:hypothetical protein
VRDAGRCLSKIRPRRGVRLLRRIRARGPVDADPGSQGRRGKVGRSLLNFGAPVELGTNLVNARSDGDGISTISLTAKTVPIPIGPSGFGLALSGAVVYDPFQHAANGAIFTVPVTFDLSEKLRLNINVGAQYNADPALLFATGGVGVSWNFADQWSILSEVFAIVGPGTTNPRFQSGIRYSPTKYVDWDVIYGRNLTGEQANWITLALTFRIGDQ